MSKRLPSTVLSDILHSINRIEVYIDKLAYAQFSNNFMIVEACLYNIQVIGEAVARLPEEVKNSYPQVPWSLIKGMRNRLIHEYFGTDLELVWTVIRNDLPTLKTELNIIQKNLQDQGK